MENNSQQPQDIKETLGYDYVKQVHHHCPAEVSYHNVYNALNGRAVKSRIATQILEAARKAVAAKQELNNGLKAFTRKPAA